MPWDNGGGGRKRGTAQAACNEDLLKRSQDKLGQIISRGSGASSSIAFLVATILAAVLAYYAFTFRLTPMSWAW